MLLAMFQYCPSCGKQNIRFSINKFFCPDCDFTYFHNTAAATGCIIQSGEKLLFLIRGNEPASGKLDLPGGFIDPGEGALEGLRRELREELGWEPPVPPDKSPAEVFKLFASFPNVYRYKNINYNTCDLFFTVSAPGLTESDLKIDPGEIRGVCFLRPDEINFKNIAFDSIRRAIEVFQTTSYLQ